MNLKPPFFRLRCTKCPRLGCGAVGLVEPHAVALARRPAVDVERQPGRAGGDRPAAAAGLDPPELRGRTVGRGQRHGLARRGEVLMFTKKWSE